MSEQAQPTEARITRDEKYLAALRRVTEALRAARRRRETKPEQEGGAR